jgi:hypothetical protein
MRIDEGRRDEIAGGVDHAGGHGLDPGFDGRDAVAPDGDVGRAARRAGCRPSR